MKKGICLLALGICALMAVACSSMPKDKGVITEDIESNETKDEVKDQKKILIKCANYFGEQHPLNRAFIDTFQPMFEEKTQGRYQFELYPNGALGGEKEITEAVERGTLEMMIGGVLLSDEVPELKVLDFPWVFENVETSCTAMNDEEIIQAIDNQVQKLGIRCRGFILNGVRSISNNKRQIKSVADCKEIKIRVPEVSQFVDYAKALGFEPETLSMSELQVALQQGVIDGQENPPTTLLTSGWYKNQKYLSMTKHQITYQWVAVNSQFYNSMSLEDQKIFDECCQAYAERTKDLYIESEKEDLQILSQNMMINEVDRDAFREVGNQIISEYCEKYPEFEEILNRVKEKEQRY